uniref:Leukotriene C4 synthase n=1 Tax=Scleropages formosus TaxID=113540 RepID=A0A8C9TA80_SCLFO
MLEEVVCVAAVTVLGVLEQAYFSLQVIYARRKYSVSPPATAGPPEFERVFRAQANCSEYFPIFIVVLWVSGAFFSQAVSSGLGLLYLYGRYRYFKGYSASAQGRYAGGWGLDGRVTSAMNGCECRTSAERNTGAPLSASTFMEGFIGRESTYVYCSLQLTVIIP